MRIIFDDINKVCVTDCTIEEINENFPRNEFPFILENTNEGHFLLFRK